MTRLTDPWVVPRPDLGRFVSDQRYHRPDLHLWWFFAHQAEIAALARAAAFGTVLLVGIRAWRRITTPARRNRRLVHA